MLAFDTGLSRSTRELLVGAISAALAELKRPTKYLAGIISAPCMAAGRHDENFVADLVPLVNGRVPCIAIATGDDSSTPASEDGLEMIDEIEVGVYVLAGSQVGAVDGRLFVGPKAASDDTQDPGAFAIMQHVVERLQGAELGLEGVGAPLKKSAGEIITLADISIWEIKFRVAASFSINPDRNATAVLTSIEALHKGDGIPDATSLDPLIDTVSPIDP